MVTLADNFKEGDFVYGMNDCRSTYINTLRDKGIHGPYTVDEYNNYILTQAKDGKNAQWTEEKEADLKAYIKDNRLAITYESFEVFLNILKTTRPKLQLQRNDFPIKLEDNKEVDKKLTPTMRSRIRACKAILLDYPKKLNKTIHFVLDGIDLSHVINREYSIQSDSKGKDSSVIHDGYTNAELRFVFKHYSEIFEKKDSIKFYSKGHEIDLFDWISQQPKVAKDSLVKYATKKSDTSTLQRITSATSKSSFPSTEKENFHILSSARLLSAPLPLEKKRRLITKEPIIRSPESVDLIQRPQNLHKRKPSPLTRRLSDKNELPSFDDEDLTLLSKKQKTSRRNK